MKTNDEVGATPLMRLNRFLAQCGVGSRRKCDELIATGHIYCNGERVVALGVKVDPVKDRIEYHGKQVKRVHALEYIAYYKPREVVVTADDPEERRTVYQYIKEKWRDCDHLRYIGRLDYQSEGLLLFTNDGDLIHALTHPRFKIKKVYQVKAERQLTQEEISRLLAGVTSDDQLLRAGAVRSLSVPEPGRVQFWYEIDLFEGKNRQIRRMFAVLDILVGRLRRVQFGSVKLEGLGVGEVRPLTPKEVAALRNSGFKK